MALFDPQILGILDDPIARAYTLVQPPIGWYVPAEAINADSQSSVANDPDNQSAYVDGYKEVQSQGVAKRQDTYLTGTGGRTGREFDAVAGTWYDDWIAPGRDKYGLYFPDGTAGQTFEVVSHDTTNAIEFAEIWLGRDMAPPGSDPAHTATNNNAYLHLAYQSPSGTDLRLAFEYGNPIRLDYTLDGGATWQGVAYARQFGNVEHYLANNGRFIQILVRPDFTRGIVWVAIGNGEKMLRCKPWGIPLQKGDDPALGLPSPGNIRLVGQNGGASLEYYPQRHKSAQFTTRSRDFGRPLANLDSAKIVPLGRSDTDSDQDNTGSISTSDGQNVAFTLSGSLPDAGDGLGSDRPARLNGGMLLLDEVWSNDRTELGLPPDVGIQILKAMVCEEVQTFDDATRTLTTSMLIRNNNYLYEYMDAVGERWIDLVASNDNINAWPRFSGRAGVGYDGLHTFSTDTTHLFDVPISDMRCMLTEPLGEEMEFDGWCLFSAVRYVCRCCGVHPLFLQTIPFWPDGPADETCPFPVLGRGTGASPRYRYYPDAIGWAILQQWVQDSGSVEDLQNDPRFDGGVTISLPYYMGFDQRDIPEYGVPQFRFEAFDPAGLMPKVLYSTVDPSGMFRVEPPVELYSSSEQMRTELIFQGLDRDDFSLIQQYIPQPPFVLGAIGRRRAWIERSARFSDQQSLLDAMEPAAVQAQLPTLTLRFPAPFQPGIYAGDRIAFFDPATLSVYGDFYIVELRNRYGLSDLTGGGQQTCSSLITARWVDNAPHS